MIAIVLYCDRRSADLFVSRLSGPPPVFFAILLIMTHRLGLLTTHRPPTHWFCFKLTLPKMLKADVYATLHCFCAPILSNVSKWGFNDVRTRSPFSRRNALDQKRGQ